MKQTLPLQQMILTYQFLQKIHLHLSRLVPPQFDQRFRLYAKHYHRRANDRSFHKRDILIT
jgi:hypothetical protein